MSEYPTYLVHFNKNHSKANGQFISGDGDADGIIDDHHHYSTNVKKKSAPSDVKPTSRLKATLGSKEFHKDTIKKAAVATAVAGAAVVTAAVIIKAVGNKEYNQYSLEADNGRKWIEAGDFYRASSARVVGGDW